MDHLDRMSELTDALLKLFCAPNDIGKDVMRTLVRGMSPCSMAGLAHALPLRRPDKNSSQ